LSYTTIDLILHPKLATVPYTLESKPWFHFQVYHHYHGSLWSLH
jgi:hypothetical protein